MEVLRISCFQESFLGICGEPASGLGFLEVIAMFGFSRVQIYAA